MFGNVLMSSFEIFILISGLGVVAIPFGNPKFLSEAIIVELSFITLSVLVWSREMDELLTTREVLEMPIELTEGRRTSVHSYLGVCY
jgi:hypothetical protein